MRNFGFPADLTEPLFLFRDDGPLKAHEAYKAAKSGDGASAIRVIQDLALPLHAAVMEKMITRQWPVELVFVAPHAREAKGDNAIPQVLATMLSVLGGELDEEIVQTTKVYHTGADAMERLISRASFQGRVRREANYVLVDDVTTLGGTLCDLSDYIRRSGGNVVGAVVLVNASRSGRLSPAPKIVQRLDKEFGHVIRETFDIEPVALTADEAQYLVGFRSAEEIRGRSAKAKQTTDIRLRAKGIFVAQVPQHGFWQGQVTLSRKLPFPGASAITHVHWSRKRKN